MQVILKYDDGHEVSLSPAKLVLIANTPSDEDPNRITTVLTADPFWLSFVSKVVDLQLEQVISSEFQITNGDSEERDA